MAHELKKRKNYSSGSPQFTCVISTTQQNRQSQQTRHGVINIQLLVFPCSRESKRSTNRLKRRRNFLESSDEEDLWTISVSCEASFCHSPRFWWFWHIFDIFMSTFCWLFGMNCNCGLKTKMRKWVVFFDELWVSSSTRRNKWQDFIVESFL